jgi:hypothetical protein
MTSLKNFTAMNVDGPPRSLGHSLPKRIMEIRVGVCSGFEIVVYATIVMIDGIMTASM